MEKRNRVNNAFYDTLHTLWHEGAAHPIALLRAENALRNPWIGRVLENRQTQKCKVLDIGCGGGLLTNALAKQGHQVYGIDSSLASLQIAREKDATSTVHYERADATALPFLDHSFDAVCAMDLLEHVEDPMQVITEASRVLRKGGLFFFHTFNRNLLSWLIVIKGVEWCIRNTPSDMHLYRCFIKPREVTTMCQKNHLKVEKMCGVVPDVKTVAFWKMLLTRDVPQNFRFIFSPSLKTGYSGYAVKL